MEFFVAALLVATLVLLIGIVYELEKPEPEQPAPPTPYHHHQNPAQPPAPREG